MAAVILASALVTLALVTVLRRPLAAAGRPAPDQEMVLAAGEAVVAH
jgi:hypothetical protein